MRGLRRHLLVAFFSLFLVYLFYLSRSGWDPMHSWNRAFADTSLLLLILTLMIGPLSRIFKYFKGYLSWRSALGVWSAITAILHVFVVFDGWFQWQFIRVIAGIDQATGQLFFDPGFTLANLTGVLGLLYILLLGMISNKKAINFLGKRSWDYLQQKSSLLYTLIVLHTAFFLFFYRLGNENWLQKPFLITIALMFVLQCSVFTIFVWKLRKKKT